MIQPQQIDVLIVGSGPAGMSIALHLVKANPKWADRIVVIEKAIHPREKLCGGAVTDLGEDVLSGLGLPFEPPHVLIREMRMVYQDRVFTIRDDPVLRIVRRDEFDHWLVQQGEQQGVIIRQGEAVKAITPRTNYVEMVTEQVTFHAKVVVAADGSRSFVRQKLKWGGETRTARLLEVLTPEVADKQIEFREGIAIFDFSQMNSGVQGYYWDFPSLVKGQPFMNRGVFDSRTWVKRPRVSLKQAFQKALVKRERNLNDYELKGHPIYWFDRQGKFARPRILLAGDAAGVDPLLGEGISFALAYGQVAAMEIIDAFARQDFNFATYKKHIMAHPILKQLHTRTIMARLLYMTKNPFLLARIWNLMTVLFQLTVWYRRWKRSTQLY